MSENEDFIPHTPYSYASDKPSGFNSNALNSEVHRKISGKRKEVDTMILEEKYTSLLKDQASQKKEIVQVKNNNKSLSRDIKKLHRENSNLYRDLNTLKEIVNALYEKIDRLSYDDIVNGIPNRLRTK